jgi:hypothetical protein
MENTEPKCGHEREIMKLRQSAGNSTSKARSGELLRVQQKGPSKIEGSRRGQSKATDELHVPHIRGKFHTENRVVK